MDACRPNETDALLREMTAMPEDVSLSDPAPALESHGAEVVGEGVAHVALEVVADHTVAAGGIGAGVYAAVTIGMPALAGAGCYAMIVHAREAGEHDSVVHERDVMRGGLAALEGRENTPTVEAERRRSPGYDEGFRRASAFCHAHPYRFEEIARAIRSSVREGEAAVASGRDHGPEHDCRYRADAAFRHGVDYMRFEREYNPGGFEARAAMARDIDSRRQGAPVRP